ncbi:hypothetical protein PHYSODRAFT_561151 [Phytophthora sojae]|uniref:FAD-binding FR-type domain-containing protein n=1 Tax=Phytophthora sojae (strain P6497) TaxID=1094619 RepID=G4ZLW4_PHYSP|nr:hypothetical protein PHYSODRAFT_561151 [Phytophthora sojae]EGZ15299.1 hypothetical protein PHYSODRAFT_561151 [Phytophthora sojae]|eukprot:XP_009529048.1 hypothetical protein PHYSODRAFT_561151 [Phytophthora sojae]
MASDYEPEVEPALSPPRSRLSHKHRHAGLWRSALASTLKLLASLCFVLFVAGQAAYVSPLYREYIQAKVAAWWESHEEMVDPSYLLLVGVGPTLTCVLLVQWVRRLQTQRGVWCVATLLRRRPSPNWLSYGELLFLAVLVSGNALVFWYGYTKRHGHKPRFTGDPPHPQPSPPSGSSQYVKMVGNALGFNCEFNMALLFLPATRNSAWMEAINMSYANGIKYHRWLGVAAVLTGIVHCACYYYCWLEDGRWQQMALPCWDCSLRERKGRKIWVNVFGEAALLCFLLIGVTSIPWVRRKMFNLFYNIHQLLFVAVIFTILHWARALWFLLPALVAYLISRVLSHCNSSTAAQVVQFSALSPTLCKLVIARVPGQRGQFHVGQFVYVNVPAIARLEWHAFTIASSPRKSFYDQSSSNSMTLVVKALGDWTDKLMEYQQKCERDGIKPEVYVDGYYGASLGQIYSAYTSVVLVGGGVGVTPLLGVLEDICAAAETRQIQGRRIFPRRVAAIFVVRELELLKEMHPLLARIRDLDPQGRYISVKLALTTTPRPEELDASLYSKDMWPEHSPSLYKPHQDREFNLSTKQGCPFGASLGSGGIAMLQFVIFGVVVGLLMTFQFGNGVLIDGLQDSVWVIQLLVKAFALFAAGICVYGGIAVLRWTRWAEAESKSLTPPYTLENAGLEENLLPQTRQERIYAGVCTYRDLLSDLQVEVGGRPDLAVHLRGLHTEHRQRCAGGGCRSPIGVLVSGPESLKTAAARAAVLVGAGDFDIREEEFEL